MKAPGVRPVTETSIPRVTPTLVLPLAPTSHLLVAGLLSTCLAMKCVFFWLLASGFLAWELFCP